MTEPPIRELRTVHDVLHWAFDYLGIKGLYTHGGKENCCCLITDNFPCNVDCRGCMLAATVPCEVDGGECCGCADPGDYCVRPPDKPFTVPDPLYRAKEERSDAEIDADFLAAWDKASKQSKQRMQPQNVETRIRNFLDRVGNQEGN